MNSLWTWLPQASAALQFGSALIGFSIAVHTLARRIRRRARRRR